MREKIAEMFGLSLPEEFNGFLETTIEADQHGFPRPLPDLTVDNLAISLRIGADTPINFFEETVLSSELASGIADKLEEALWVINSNRHDYNAYYMERLLRLCNTPAREMIKQLEFEDDFFEPR